MKVINDKTLGEITSWKMEWPTSESWILEVGIVGF